MIFPKFIIDVAGDVILGKVERHHELSDEEGIRGGGMFNLDKETKTVTFSGNSHDFGSVTTTDLRTAIAAGKVFTNKYKTHPLEGYKFQFYAGSELIDLNELPENKPT